MKINISLFLFSFACLQGLSQNLIMNPGFEDANICRENNSPCAPAGWISTTSTMPAYQGEKSKYIRMTVFNTMGKNRRDYIQTQFLCDLKEGAEYTISIKIKQDECVISSFGLLITDQIYYRRKAELLDAEPNIDLSDELQKHSEKSQKNWITITVNYTAKGGEKFIVLGNFQKDDEQKRKFIKAEKDFVDYKLAIDDVHVTPVIKDTVCPYADSIKRTWYAYDYRHRDPFLIPFVPSEKEKNTTITKIEKVPEQIKPSIDSLVLDDIIFEFNSSDLLEEAKQMIEEKLGAYDKALISEIQIIGHTDNIGKKDYNRDLSLKRAESVKEILISLNFNEKTIFTTGAGDEKPVSDNNTEEGRKKNRRIEIKIIYK